MRAFEAVGQNLSFTGGASALSVSQSAMSRHVGGLEELLGKQLFIRDASRLTLTAAGEELLPVVSKCLDRLEQTMNSIRDDEMTGRSLRLHVPPSLLQQLFLPMLRDFRAEHPDIRLDVSSAHVTGLPPTDFDMAIAYDRPNVDDRVTDLLWMVRVAPLCSAETAKASEGKSLEQFLGSQELLHLKLDGEPRDLLWLAYLRQCGLAVSTQGGLAFDTTIAAAQYAMTANGVFLGDVDMFAQEIADGRLVMPYEAIIEDGYGYYLKLHADDLADPAISMIRSWLISRFGALRPEPRLDAQG
ncbi:LysR family transcriptional regulator [Sphingorhabdus contaminans]|uniref:LysR family transcriptional regulator n=1 Tax=Sphingorhabdus contaminans TaxID=1343899 RepID=A0A553WK19_9SPHN|nr:LysR family transcriptional regulator [Sphingorhabdus contaminans]TSB04994.1 LysR family transcriptional regulator [Sphingorhabdus contaminans]